MFLQLIFWRMSGHILFKKAWRESMHQGANVAGQFCCENNKRSFASDCCFVKFLLQFHTLRVNSSKASLSRQTDFQGNSIFTDVQRTACSQRKTVSAQLIWVCAADSLIYGYSCFSMNHFKEEKNRGGELEEERGKTIDFGCSATGDTVCSLQRKLREITLLPFKHFEYILNVKTDLYFGHFSLPW